MAGLSGRTARSILGRAFARSSAGVTSAPVECDFHGADCAYLGGKPDTWLAPRRSCYYRSAAAAADPAVHPGVLAGFSSLAAAAALALAAKMRQNGPLKDSLRGCVAARQPIQPAFLRPAMVFEHIEKLKREYTDKYVVVDESRPELARFKGYTGQVKTVNMSGRALVQFLDYHNNIAWYDIDLSFLRVVDKPAPPAAEKKGREHAAPARGAAAAAKPAAAEKVEAAPSAESKPAAGKKTTAEILAAARAGKAAAAPQPTTPTEPAAAGQAPAPAPSPAEAAGQKRKLSTAEILAAARGKAASPAGAAGARAAAGQPPSGSPPAPSAAPTPSPPPAPSATGGEKRKLTTAEILAAARGKPLPKVTTAVEAPAAATAASPQQERSAAELLAAARRPKASSAAAAPQPAQPQPAESVAPTPAPSSEAAQSATSASPMVSAGKPTTTAEKIAWCRRVDAKKS